MPQKENVNQLLRSVDDCLLTVKVFARDVQVKFSSLGAKRFIPEPERKKRAAKRSKIISFSKRSARRLRHVVRNTEEIWKAFITLTYPSEFPLNGTETKKHLNAFLQWLRRQEIKYVWVLEFQERGAPHYHIIVSDFIPKEELSRAWYDIVGSWDERHLRAGTQIAFIQSKRQLYSYLSGYLKKMHQKIPPVDFQNVGRFWGATRNILICTMFQKVEHFYKLSRMTKLLRNWYRAHLRQYGIKWKWKGKGFVVLDGQNIMTCLNRIREDVLSYSFFLSDSSAAVRYG